MAPDVKKELDVVIDFTLKGGAAVIQKVNTRLGAMKKNLTSIKGLLATGFVGVGIAKFSKGIIQAADVSEQLRVRLSVLLGSVKEGNKLFDEMAQFASKVPFEYEEIMESATVLAGIMEGGVDEIKMWMPLIGDLAATTGLTIQETTEQVQRMLSAGAASADRFRERGVLAMLGFQAGVSVSAEETKNRLLAAWNDQNSKFRGATDKLANTWSGQLSMMADKWFQFRNMVADAGLFELLKDRLRDLNQAFADWLKNIEPVLKDRLPVWLDRIERIIRIIIKQISELVTTWMSLPVEVQTFGLVGALIFGKKGIALLVLLTHMLGVSKNIITAIGKVFSSDLKFTDFMNMNAEELAEWLKEFKKVKDEVIAFDIVAKIPTEIPPSIENIKRQFFEIEGFLKGFSSTYMDLIDQWSEPWFRLGDQIANVFDSAIGKGLKFFKKIGDGFGQMLRRMAVELATQAIVIAFLDIISGGAFSESKGGFLSAVWKGFKGALGFNIATGNQFTTTAGQFAGQTTTNNLSFSFNNTFSGDVLQNEQNFRNFIVPQIEDSIRSGLLRIRA
jgi:hypothetical protein